jgi:pimeloyl-ACP methyl ester carboxylesterase
VFLPSCPTERDELPPLLSKLVPVDFRVAGTKPLEHLVWAIKGDEIPVIKREPEKILSSSASLLEVVRKHRRTLKLRLGLAIVGITVPLLGFGAWRAYENWIGCGMMADERISVHPGRNIAHYIRRGNPDRVLVFVHGIFGNPEDTWTFPPDTYWPDLVAQDDAFRDTDIYVAGYDTGMGNRMTIDEVAANLNQRFIDAGVFNEHRQVVFVCHSLGGLIVQQFLLKYRAYAAKVPLIYFYATPQTGAQIARLASIFSDDPLLQEMAPGASNDYLRIMESNWHEAGFTIRRDCAYEKLRFKCVLVVDEMSGTRSCDSAVALNKNHINIVKPHDSRDDSYVLLRNAWRELNQRSN